MKYTLRFYPLLFISLSSTSFADCNLELATAAGQYLEALEKANLKKYQNSSVCEVLNYEFLTCSNVQKANLESKINLKEVLGIYCQPHLPPPKTTINKDHFMKGANLYSWRDHSGYIWYALLPGTNRTKNAKELTDNKINPGYLMKEFKNIPSKTHIVWNNLVTIDKKSKLEFALPEDKTLKEILSSAESAGLKVNLMK